MRLSELPHARLIGGDAKEHGPVYFIEEGLVSLVQRMEDGRAVEVGAIGLDGITGSFSLRGLAEPTLEAIVQIPVSAIQVPRQVLVEEMSREDLLRGMVGDYVRYLIRLIAQTAACNRLHTIVQRSCRWLLTAHDAARADTFYLTHEFLAEMLGVQRSGVSAAANELRAMGMIDYRRGRLTVLDRQRLEDSACECYTQTRQVLEAVFDRAAKS